MKLEKEKKGKTDEGRERKQTRKNERKRKITAQKKENIYGVDEEKNIN